MPNIYLRWFKRMLVSMYVDAAWLNVLCHGTPQYGLFLFVYCEFDRCGASDEST